MTEYAFETTVDVRTADVGRTGHVNNSRFVDFLDLARDRYFEAVHGYSPGDFPHVIARLELDFEREIRLLDPLTVSIGVDDVGTTSLTLRYEIRSAGEVKARARTVVVVVEDVGSPAPVPADVCERLQAADVAAVRD